MAAYKMYTCHRNVISNYQTILPMMKLKFPKKTRNPMKAQNDAFKALAAMRILGQ